MRRGPLRPLVPALVAGLLLTGCTTASPPAPSPSSAEPSATPTVTPTPTLAERAAQVVAEMTPEERAGQLLMTAGTVEELRGLAASVREYHLGGVMVRGRSTAGAAAVATALGPVSAAAPADLPLLTATDQEGGTVQVLSGPGFSRIPSAVAQGRGSVASTRADAETWGAQLAKAGVRLDLAPVADVPCAADVHRNPPIAALYRQYSSDPQTAASHVAAFVQGMEAAGVDTAVKHFPGLGCVTQNTDTTARVVDTTTSVENLLPSFAAGIGAGTRFVMVSNAQYARIDPGVPALFSSRIIRGLLRERLGFTGVVMSDDVGGAAAVRGWTPAQRALRFMRAGGDLLLDVQPTDIPPMHAALVSEASRDAAFGTAVTAAATQVVEARLRLASR